MNLLIRLALSLLLLGQVDEPQPVISQAAPDDEGFLRHAVRSPFQAGETEIRVLPPTTLDPGKRYKVVYLLPVEAKDERRYGVGLHEVRQGQLQDRHQVIFVAPTFSHLPWYADHPADRSIRQESYLLQVVLPFVERTYPVQTDRAGRLLLGFSKSGWGAFSLLLRHPNTFGKAAAWDAPLMMARPGLYGSAPIFGTAENFQAYQVTKLLRAQAPLLRAEPRLSLLGYGSFRGEHQAVHELMQRLDIPHIYRDGPMRRHDWHSGWVAEAVRDLLEN